MSECMQQARRKVNILQLDYSCCNRFEAEYLYFTWRDPTVALNLSTSKTANYVAVNTRAQLAFKVLASTPILSHLSLVVQT